MKYNTQRLNLYNCKPGTVYFDYLAHSTDNTQDEAEPEAEAQSSLLTPQCFGYCPSLLLMVVPKREDILFGKCGIQSTFPKVKFGCSVCSSAGM